MGLFVQFSDRLREVHSREAEGDTGDTSQQAESCSRFLPRKRADLQPVLGWGLGAGKDRAGATRLRNSEEELQQAAALLAIAFQYWHFLFLRKQVFSKGEFAKPPPCSQLVQVTESHEAHVASWFGLIATFVIIPKLSLIHNHRLHCPPLQKLCTPTMLTGKKILSFQNNPNNLKTRAMWHDEGKITAGCDDTLHLANVSLLQLTGKLLSKAVDLPSGLCQQKIWF